MSTTLTNQTALVTGGTRGIGYAISRALYGAGANVHLCGRSQEHVDRAVESIRKEVNEPAGTVEGSVADVANWESVRGLFDRVEGHWSKLDILVCNAGLGIFKPMAELQPEEWHRVIDLNLSGVYYCCHAGLPLLKASGKGYVFNISSLAGKNPFAGGAAYNASKFGVNGFTEAMMLDHRQEDIRFTLVMPGSVSTDFGSIPGTRVKSGDWKIQPQDIADVILSLLALPVRTTVSRVEMRPSKPPK